MNSKTILGVIGSVVAVLLATSVISLVRMYGDAKEHSAKPFHEGAAPKIEDIDRNVESLKKRVNRIRVDQVEQKMVLYGIADKLDVNIPPPTGDGENADGQ